MRTTGERIPNDRKRNLPSTVPGFIGFLILLGVWASSAQSQEDFPYAKLGDQVLAVFTVESWDSLWELVATRQLGTRILTQVRQELFPALAETTGSATTVTEIATVWDTLAHEIEWQGIRHSRLGWVFWMNPEFEPRLTVAVTPRTAEMEQVHREISHLFSLFAANSQGWLQWRSQGKDRVLLLADSDSGSASTGKKAESRAVPILWVRQEAGSVWITYGHRAEEAYAGPGLASNPAFKDLWHRIPHSKIVTFVVNLGPLVRLEEELGMEDEPVKMSPPSWESSLVVDETMEALFKNDPETLENLKEVDRGMDFWSSQLSGNPQRLAARLLRFVADLGIVVTAAGPVEGGIRSTTLWSPVAGSESGVFWNENPLPESFLSLLRQDADQITVLSVPDWEGIYRYVWDTIALIGNADQIKKEWRKVQEPLGFSVEDDLLPVIGRELAWMSRQGSKTALQGFPLASNQFYFFLSLRDATKARETLSRLEKLLTDAGLVVSSSRVGELDVRVMDTGIFGKAVWGIVDDPPVLVIAKGGDFSFLNQAIADMREGSSEPVSGHPEWETLKSIWKPNPTAVSISDLRTSWKQTLDQLKGARMMISMTGAADPVALSLVGLFLETMNSIPPPECFFQVDSVEDGIHVSSTLTLFGDRTNDD